MPAAKTTTSTFCDLNLPAPLLATLTKVGYEIPTPIQVQAIPHLLKGLDLLGHAPTGTGKTAAFALPLLARIDLKRPQVQVMTLTPTRELAIQVAKAFQTYGSQMRGFHVLPIYGGQAYAGQIQQLKRGVHVVVGTPGRVADHMRKGTLKLGNLQALVLDEADEMLRMGFIDEVEWILEQTPKKRQMALFSATMPRAVERIARHHLNDPQQISIKARTATAETVRQRYWLVSGLRKLDALTRILEVETTEAILIFVRTKIATTELAERLEARGYSAAAMNGDMAQNHREQTIERFKRGSLDILVATDVAARGLDVERISHVINFDIPYDAEAYIHRIGRTGRAGRLGNAILFVAPRERRMLNAIERATRQKIEPLQLPSTETVNKKRIEIFKQKISDMLATGGLEFLQNLVDEYQQEHDVPPIEIAAALAAISIGDQSLLLKPDRNSSVRNAGDSYPRRDHGEQRQSRHRVPTNGSFETFRLEIGSLHGVKPGNIVGAIANEAGLDGQHIGQIKIQDQYSFVDLPTGMSQETFNDLRKVRVCGQVLNISRPNKSSIRRNSEPKFASKKENRPAPRSSKETKPKPPAKKRSAKAKATAKAKAKEKKSKRKKSRSAD